MLTAAEILWLNDAVRLLVEDEHFEAAKNISMMIARNCADQVAAEAELPLKDDPDLTVHVPPASRPRRR